MRVRLAAETKIGTPRATLYHRPRAPRTDNHLARRVDEEAEAMGAIVLLSLTAALNPTLLAATTVMLLLPKPDDLLFGYWLGAMLTGIASGLVIVFALEGSGAVGTTRHTVSPAIDLVLAGLALVAAFAVAKGEVGRVRERYDDDHAKKEKQPPKWQRVLRAGDARHTFVVGVLLSFPGASYLAALDRLTHLHYPTVLTVLIVIGFTLVQLILLEIPMLAFKVWPNETPAAIESAKTWASKHAREYGASGLAIIGVALAIIGVAGVL
jgi:hypothetical protein